MLDAPRRRYTEEEIAGAVLAVKDNMGYVKPTAERLGIPRDTLNGWVTGSRRSRGAATRAVMQHKAEEQLLKGYLELAIASQRQALEQIGEAKARDATIVSGISYDKYLLGTGRPTSRSEQVKARYVEGDSLRSIASRVVDVPALPSGLSRRDRTPKVAGGQGRGSYLTQPAKSKGKKRSARKKRSPNGGIVLEGGSSAEDPKP